MKNQKSLSPKKIVAKIKTAQKLKGDDKEIISTLSKAIKAGNKCVMTYRSSEQSSDIVKYCEWQSRIFKIVHGIFASQKLELLLHCEIEIIKGEVETWEHLARTRLDETGLTASEALENRRRALMEGENASMLLAIRRVPAALDSPLAVMRADVTWRPSPWLDSVTDFWTIEWAYFNRYLLYWGLSPTSHELCRLLSLRKMILRKFLRLYLEFRSAVTPPQSENEHSLN